MDENWSTQLAEEVDRSVGVGTPFSWTDCSMEKELFSERSGCCGCDTNSTLLARLDSEAATGVCDSDDDTFAELEYDCSSQVTPSTSMPSRMCLPSVGSSAITVNEMSCWFCSNLLRRLDSHNQSGVLHQHRCKPSGNL